MEIRSIVLNAMRKDKLRERSKMCVRMNRGRVGYRIVESPEVNNNQEIVNGKERVKVKDIW